MRLWTVKAIRNLLFPWENTKRYKYIPIVQQKAGKASRKKQQNVHHAVRLAKGGKNARLYGVLTVLGQSFGS